jgi:hypothetical protein
MRNVTHVPAILKLTQILRKMLPADMDMRAVDAALESGPEAFESVDTGAAEAGILAALVAHGDVPEAVEADILVTAELVCVDRGSGQDVLIDERVHRTLVAGRGNARRTAACWWCWSMDAETGSP